MSAAEVPSLNDELDHHQCTVEALRLAIGGACQQAKDSEVSEYAWEGLRALVERLSDEAEALCALADRRPPRWKVLHEERRLLTALDAQPKLSTQPK